MDFRRMKVGTLLGLGIAAIIGLMIAGMIYSNYLTTSAQNIIQDSTERIFDVLTIQRDTEELFSALDDVDIYQDQGRLDEAEDRIAWLHERAQNTIKEGREKEIFSEEDTARANETLDKVAGISTEIFKLKAESIENGGKEEVYNGVTPLDFQFTTLRNVRYDMLGVVNDIIIRSDEEFRGAMDLVQRAQTITWIVVGASLALAVLLGFFLVRSAKKIYDLKNEFVNIIAHDLRNPVTAIIGYLDLIVSDKGKSSAKFDENLQVIVVSTQKLRSQINNLLEVGRTEAGHIKLNLEPVLAVEVIKESVLRAQALAESSGIIIDTAGVKDDKVSVLADRSKLSDVMDNLISNAIKYNKKGGTVTISTADAGELLRILVVDTGRGIPENQKKRIFKKYSRVEEDGDKKVSGTGLGLYTVKLAMDQMNGTATFKTKKDVGTTFTVSFRKAISP